MNMTHAEAQRRLQARLDGLLSAQELTELDEHLLGCAECRQASEQMETLQLRLKRSLQQRYPLEEPGKGQVQAVMERVSRNLAGKESRPSRLRFPAGLAWSGAALLVVALLAWSIRNLLPSQQLPESTPLSLATESPAPAVTSSPASAAQSASPAAPAPQPAAPGEIAQPVGLFPSTEFSFAAQFPESPATIQLYRQGLSEPVTIESARAIAASLGVNGEVYQSTGEGGETILEVSDGSKLVRFIGTTGVFVYVDSLRQRQEFLPAGQQLEDRVNAALGFLQAHDLLDHPYRVAGVDVQPGMVDLLPELEGRPVIFGIGDQPGGSGWASVELSADLQPSAAYYTRQQFEPVGEYPLLNARQAWERLSGSDPLSYAQYAVLAPSQPSTYRDWLRQYAPGEFLHLFGYAIRMTAAEPGGSDLVTLGNLALRGDTSGIPMSRLVHLWGVTEAGENGVLWFNLQGWELSTLEDTYLTGKISRQGEQVFFNSDGTRYLLPDAPVDLPDQLTLQGWGIILPDSPARFEWSSLSSGEYPSTYSMTRACGGGGGGGGGGPENANFGGGSLKLPYLQSGARPTPSAPASQFQIGQRVEGWAGTVYLSDFQEAGGVRREISFATQPGFEFNEWFAFYLQGGGLAGVEAYQNLPVRVWGQVSGFNQGLPLIEVERFEPLYPGVALQEFAGTQSEISIDGQPALLLTTQDGAQYIEEQSLGYGEQNRIGRPGDLVETEGYLVPDKTLGGYPVIRATSGGFPPDGVVTSAQVQVIDMGLGGGVDLSSAMAGQVIIDSIELAYTAVTLQNCPPMGMDEEFLAKYLTMQPVWVFKGTFEDGRRFEAQVQALPDEYLE
jgi:hypothetical protein